MNLKRRKEGRKDLENLENKKEDLKFMNSKQRKEGRKRSRIYEFKTKEGKKERRILNLEEKKEEISNL